MAIVWIVPKTITIDIDAKDVDGNELVTTEEIRMLLTKYEGYIDHNSRKIVLYRSKMNYDNGGGIHEEKNSRIVRL